MNAKTLTIKTIVNNGYIIGKSKSKKGTEIFDSGICVFSSKSYVNVLRIDEDMPKVKSLKEKYNVDELYLVQCYFDNCWYNPCTFENQHMSINEFFKIYEENPEKFASFSINRKPKLLGYLPLSQYKSTKESQIQLCKDLINLGKQIIFGDCFEDCWDMEYDDSINKFENSTSKGNYYKDDYYLEHGSKWCQNKSDCEYFDGRLNNSNESEMDFFEFNENNYLKEIDPSNTISVYHRKGKDWYIGYSIDSQDMYIYYKDENYQYTKDEFEEDTVYFYTYEENEELLEEVKNYLQNCKEDLEVRCFVANELDEDYQYRELFNFDAIDLVFEDRDVFETNIKDNFSWTYETMKVDLLKTYEETIYEQITVTDDYKVIVKNNTDEMKTFNHLAIINRLAKKYNYELVNSYVLENIEIKSWSIKKDDEEYHFNILEVIVDEINENVSLKDFVLKALSSIEKRKIEKIKKADLYEKASKVFIGISDSLNSGNCELGTKQFIAKYKIDTNFIGGIRGDALLDLERSNFTMRAVSYAISNRVAA